MPQQQLRILIGDDEKDAVATLLELLRAEGHEVRGVYSGRAVLDMVRDFGPDVVLLDIGMPLVSGYEVARTLRERYASARPLLVAVTGRNTRAPASSRNSPVLTITSPSPTSRRRSWRSSLAPAR